MRIGDFVIYWKEWYDIINIRRIALKNHILNSNENTLTTRNVVENVSCIKKSHNTKKHETWFIDDNERKTRSK